MKRLSLRVTEDLLPCCVPLTGAFTIVARTGCSVRDLLCGPLGVPADYLERRIQTIFLNGRVVDDPAVATVPDRSTIALSAAMPGVAGAMLRKRSPYAAMRSAISHPGGASDREEDRQGRLVIKLFNTVRDELGPTMLRRGIQVSGEALHNLFRGRSKTFRTGILEARIDDDPFSLDLLFETDWADQEILLHVRSSLCSSAADRRP